MQTTGSSQPKARRAPVVSKKRGFAIAAVMALLFIVLVGNMYFGIGTIKEIQKLPGRYWNRGANVWPRTFAPWQIPQSLVFNGLDFANSSIDPQIPKGITFKTSSPVGMTESLLCDRYCHLDVIYTWVNGSDIPFKFKKFSTVGETSPKDKVDEALRKYPLKMVLNRVLQANSQDKENGELAASIRGMKSYMRWHRGRTVIVSPGHVPYWMDHKRAFFGVSFQQGQKSKGGHQEAKAWWSTARNAREVALHKHYIEDQFNEGQGINDRKHEIVKGAALPHDLVTTQVLKQQKHAKNRKKRLNDPTTVAPEEDDSNSTAPEYVSKKVASSLGGLNIKAENTRFLVMYQDVLVPEHRRLRFSSNVVEPVLHKVPDASNVFVHMNDDYLIMNHTRVSTFVNKRGGPNLFFESGVMRGGKPQWEELKKKGGRTWVCGVYHSHAVIKEILDDDVGAASRFRQIFGQVRFKNETILAGNLTTRFFAKHSPFVYNKKVLAYLDQYDVAGKYYDRVNVRGRHCDDVYVPFIHHAVAMDAPWRGCLDEVKSAASHNKELLVEHTMANNKKLLVPNVIGLGMPHFVRNESAEIQSLSREVQCPAPATVKLGKAAENVFMMLKDNETEMRRGLNTVLKKDFTVRFVTLNDGFRNATMGRMLQHWLHYYFPRPAIVERPLYLPGQQGVQLAEENDPLHQHRPTNEDVLSSLIQDYFGEDISVEVGALEANKRRLRYLHHQPNVSRAPLDGLLAVVDEEILKVVEKRRTLATPVILVASSDDLACPLIRALELALPLLQGTVHVIIDKKGSPTEVDPLHFHFNSTLPVTISWPENPGAGGDASVLEEPVDIGFANLPPAGLAGLPIPDPKLWRPKCFFESRPDRQLVYFHEVDTDAVREKLLLDGGDHKTEYDPVALVEFVNKQSNGSIAATQPHQSLAANEEKKNTAATSRSTRAIVIPRRDYLLGQTLALEDFDEYQLEEHSGGDHNHVVAADATATSTSTTPAVLKGSILSLLEAAPKRIGSISFTSLWYALNSYMTPYCQFEECFIYV